MKRSCLGVLSLSVVLASCSSKSNGPDVTPTPLPSPSDWMDDLHTNTSCVMNCDSTCAESTMPWACPALADWSAIPHDTACGAFDGKTFPAPQKGACVATDPSDAALAKTNADGTPPILPDGRRLTPAGTEWRLNDFPGGFPSSALLVAGTKWLLVVDTGIVTNSVRVIDTTKLRAGGVDPVASSVKYAPRASLEWGMTYVDAAKTLYVASGIPDSRVYAFDLDTQTGVLTASATKTIALDKTVFPESVAASADGKTLLVGQAKDSHVLVVSLEAATYGMVTGTIDVGARDVFALRFDPNDPTGNTAYGTLWRSPMNLADPSSMRVVQIDVAGKKVQTIPVGKSPEEFAFLDARYMVVATGLSDVLTIIDRPAAKVAATVPLGTVGLEPTTVAYDPPRKRLYTTLSSANGVAVFDVDMLATPPTLTPAGIVPTAWWPTSVTVDPTDGAIYVTNGRGHGVSGANMSTGNDDVQRGSLQAVPFMDTTALTAATATHTSNESVQALTGYPTVRCNGAPYDFPIPAKIEDGPSTKIKHVIFIVRENKTFDDLFGDVPGVDGDPKLIMSPTHQNELWANARSIAKTFAHMDNFYEDAEQSIQGHYWTVYGRTSDFDERRWVQTWGRGEFDKTDSPGVGDDTAPLEGSIFESLKAQGVTVDNMGELLGGIAFRDLRWPGGTSDTVIPDTLGGCYAAARMRVLCDPKAFTYMWLGNDHTHGLSAGAPNPALMIAVNDEATGMLLDGLSRSPAWAETLVIVLEDDPSDGSDHVDAHRTIALFASPWIKRGYVSHAHYNTASVHKLFSHVFGKPYRNQTIANAPLPLDMFTSTPDYSPYALVPRKYADLACNPKGTLGAQGAEGWDFALPDNQPGLNEQVREYLRTLP